MALTCIYPNLFLCIAIFPVLHLVLQKMGHTWVRHFPTDMLNMFDMLTDDNRHQDELADIKDTYNPLVKMRLWASRFHLDLIISFMYN